MNWFVLAVSFWIGAIVRFIFQIFKHEILDRFHAIVYYRILPRCEHCKRWTKLSLEAGRTMYPFEYDSELFTNRGYFRNAHKDPNRSQLLCDQCGKYHHDYWDSEWKDYYSGRL